MNSLRLMLPVFVLLLAGLGFTSTSKLPLEFVVQSRSIPIEPLDSIPVTSENSRRSQRLDAFARDAVRQIAGTPTLWGLHPLQIYLGLAVVPDSRSVAILHLADASLKKELGLPRSRQRFSLSELEATPLERRALALPSGARGKLTSAYHQLQTLREVIDGNHFTRALTYGTDSTIQHGALLLERLAAARLDQARSSAIAIRESARPAPLTVTSRSTR